MGGSVSGLGSWRGRNVCSSLHGCRRSCGYGSGIRCGLWMAFRTCRGPRAAFRRRCGNRRGGGEDASQLRLKDLSLRSTAERHGPRRVAREQETDSEIGVIFAEVAPVIF
eukprot:4974126-Prymnesium_polylepis.1